MGYLFYNLSFCYLKLKELLSLILGNHGNRSNIAATVIETHDNLHVHLHPYPILLSL